MSAVDPYIDGSDGYHWLTCGRCGDPLIEVEGGTHLTEMRTAAADHTCQPTTEETA